MGSAPTKLSLPDIGGGGFFYRVFAGARAAFGGVRLVLTDPKLISLSFVPAIVHLALFALFLWLGFTQVAAPLVEWLAPDKAAEGFWVSLLSGIVHVIAAVVVVGASLVLSVVTGSVVNDPFYDLLSERTEEIYVGRNVGPAFSIPVIIKGILRELLATVLRLCVYGVVAVPLWLISFTPFTIVSTPLSFLWAWLFFAYEYLSRSLARHAVQPKDRFKPVFSHKALFTGFGGVTWLFSFIPLVAPILVVSATRLYLALAAYDRVPSKFTAEEKQAMKQE